MFCFIAYQCTRTSWSEFCWKTGNSWTAFQRHLAVIWTALNLRQFSSLCSTPWLTSLPRGWPTLHNVQSVTCLRNSDPLSTLRQQFHLCRHHSSFISVNELLSSNHISVWSAITTHKNHFFFRRMRRISNLAVFILGDSNIFPVFLLYN
jgi:hypothetical protein